MAKGTRKEIIADIMEWSARWGSPLSRAQAEAKADQVTNATRPRLGLVHSLHDRRGGFLLQLPPNSSRDLRVAGKREIVNLGARLQVLNPVGSTRAG